MIVAGIDAGTFATKAVVMVDGEIRGTGYAKASDNGIENDARMALNTAIEISNAGEVAKMVSTGSWRKSIPFIEIDRATSSCLAKGIKFLYPEVQTIIGIGAEASCAVKVGGKGNALDYVQNNQCASGTGTFLKDMAKLLDVKLEALSDLSLKASEKVDISNTCAVFSESEVISYIHRDPPTPKENIVAGIFESLGSRIMGMVKRVGDAKPMAMAGGVAHNDGFVAILGRLLDTNIIVPENPEFVSSVGAALIAATLESD